MKLSVCIHQFFNRYLPAIKGASKATITSYRDTFSIFLSFAARHHRIKIASLKVEHISFDMVLAFLDHLEKDRHNASRTRNHRLAVLKSFAKMIRLFYPEQQKIAEEILGVPEKRTQKVLIGYLHHQEVLKVYSVVNLKRKEGFRDFCILHLLYDSGARASELATLNLDYFDSQTRTLAILGKGNRYRQIELWPKTAELLELYIAKYRATPKPVFKHRLFVNQRGDELTRHGINRLCRKYLSEALSPKRIMDLSPVHSFRHSCAVNMLICGASVAEIKNRLGHENIQSTMVYLKLDLSRMRSVQKTLIEHTRSVIKLDPKIDELIDWENKKETLNWLDSL